MNLVTKLHPSRFPGMSGLMVGIIGFILGEEWSDPPIRSLSVTSDGFLSTEGALLEAADLDRNIANLFEAVGLGADERRAFARLYRARVEDYRQTPAAWLTAAEREEA